MKVLKTEFPYAKVATLGDAVSRDHSSVSIQLKKHDELIGSNKDYTSLFNAVNDEFIMLLCNSVNYSLSELYEVKNRLEDNLKRINVEINELENNKKLHIDIATN